MVCMGEIHDVQIKKYEARNPKLETNPNDLNTKFKTFMFRDLIIRI